MQLKGKNFLTLKDFTPEEITYFLDLAADLKEKKRKGIPHREFEGNNIALIFETTSPRTRGCGGDIFGPTGVTDWKKGKYCRYSKGSRQNV